MTRAMCQSAAALLVLFAMAGALQATTSPVDLDWDEARAGLHAGPAWAEGGEMATISGPPGPISTGDEREAPVPTAALPALAMFASIGLYRLRRRLRRADLSQI